MLTRQGIAVAVVAVAIAVTGRLLGVLEFYVLAATLGALVVAALLYTALSRLRIGVERELHPPRVHAGSPSRVELRVENHGTRRSPVLSLHDEVSGTRGAHLSVGRLRPGDVARAAYRLPTERRGILRIGPLVVNVSDPFGLTQVAMHASEVSELTVYPHIDDVAPVPQTTGNDPMAGAEHPNSLGRGGEDFYALRPYVVGDDLRRVHWLSTARHDELMVRQDELPWQGRATVLVDVRAATTDEQSLERVISAAASIVNAGARRQDLIRLLTTDGRDSGFAAGHAHVEAIMEHLAAVEASHDATFRRVLDRVASSSTGGALVAIVASMPPNELDLLLRLRRRFGSVTVVRFAGAEGRAEPGTAARDGVLTVGPAETFAARWNAAVRPRTRATGTRSWAPLQEAARVEEAVGEDRWARKARAGW